MLNEKQVLKLAKKFQELDEKRLELQRQLSPIDKEVKVLKSQLQDLIGKPNQLEVPHIAQFGKLMLTQVMQHREAYAVPAYDFITLKVAKV